MLKKYRPNNLNKILHSKNSRCFWCGKKTVIRNIQKGQITPDDTATIDHIFSKDDYRRKIFKRDGIPSPVVLSCYQCNQDRGSILFEDYLIIRNVKSKYLRRIF